MKRVNIHTVPLDRSQEQPGFSWNAAVLGPHIGAAEMGATLYELPSGQASFPYHYEYGCEEWLLVVTGTPTLRDPDGEHRLEPGDLVCFAEGPAGAHRLVNDGQEPSRVMLFSTKGRPAVVVFPDSAKVMAYTGDEREDVIVRRADAVDYWEGEA
ncbi:MAG TPA: cupin domain-containing protein [Gaiellales bacterium]|nr:cupin domain-containing protein [Gaiellales bacterium]